MPPTPGCCRGRPRGPLVIPALNRDGDCLSDLVLPMFGSIAGAESILLAFDENYNTTVAMAEAPHGTAPALQGKDLANPLAMILACGAVMHYASERHGIGCRARLARDLRGGARDRRLRHQDLRPRRLGRHYRVHDGGRRADPNEARRLVGARLARAPDLGNSRTRGTGRSATVLALIWALPSDRSRTLRTYVPYLAYPPR